MQDKLQELTNRLYTEGLSKGKEEGEILLEKAKKDASEIIDEAKKEAIQIIERAKKDAEDYKIKIESDLKMASSQVLQATKKDVENLVISKVAEGKIISALGSADFIKEIIKSVAQKFNSEEATDLSLILPENLRTELEPFVKNELTNSFKGGIDAQFSKKISGGFNIGPKNGGYFISMTDDTFKNLIGEYLRPVTKKLLFG